MTYGFQVKNGNEFITISDSQYNPQYIGLATFVTAGYWYWTTSGSVFITTSGGKVNGTYVSWLNAPIATYTITYPTARGKPIPFIVQDDSTAYGVAINAIKATGTSGSNTTWEIYINICNGRTLSAAYQPKVLIFSAFPEQTALSGYGLGVKDASGNIAFNSNLKHLVAQAGIAYPTSDCILQHMGGSAVNYSPSISYNSSMTIPNLPPNPAFFYQTGFTDFAFDSTYQTPDLFSFVTAVGRINNGKFESSCAYGAQGKTLTSASVARVPKPVLFIDSSKYL